VIPLLWRAQEQHGGWVYGSDRSASVADLLDMPYIRVLEVATFYTHVPACSRWARRRTCRCAARRRAMLRGSQAI
jgi:NADH:ubiquinone oxidoreductase subunit E